MQEGAASPFLCHPQRRRVRRCARDARPARPNGPDRPSPRLLRLLCRARRPTFGAAKGGLPGNAMGFQAERRSYPCVTPNEETARKGGYQPFGTGSPQPGPASAREPPCRQPPRMSIFLFPILPAAARKNNGQTSVRRCLSSGFFVCPPAASRASASARPI